MQRFTNRILLIAVYNNSAFVFKMLTVLILCCNVLVSCWFFVLVGKSSFIWYLNCFIVVSFACTISLQVFKLLRHIVLRMLVLEMLLISLGIRHLWLCVMKKKNNYMYIYIYGCNSYTVTVFPTDLLLPCIAHTHARAPFVRPSFGRWRCDPAASSFWPASQLPSPVIVFSDDRVPFFFLFFSLCVYSESKPKKLTGIIYC